MMGNDQRQLRSFLDNMEKDGEAQSSVVPVEGSGTSRASLVAKIWRAKSTATPPRVHRGRSGSAVSGRRTGDRI